MDGIIKNKHKKGYIKLPLSQNNKTHTNTNDPNQNSQNDPLNILFQIKQPGQKKNIANYSKYSIRNILIIHRSKNQNNQSKSKVNILLKQKKHHKKYNTRKKKSIKIQRIVKQEDSHKNQNKKRDSPNRNNISRSSLNPPITIPFHILPTKSKYKTLSAAKVYKTKFRFIIMAIKTPKILPGEKGYTSKKEKTSTRKSGEKKARAVQRKKDMTIGKIKTGSKGYRIGKPATNPRKEKRYLIWRYSRRIGEIIVSNKNTPEEEISLKFNRLGGIGNFKHLIQDADFQLQWAIREQELLMTQEKCYVCGKKISKAAKPNLYHYKMFKKRTDLLEKAANVPEEVVSGKLTIEEGWEKFNNILEEGNRYYMSLKDTALVCASCAKQKNLNE